MKCVEDQVQSYQHSISTSLISLKSWHRHLNITAHTLDTATGQVVVNMEPIWHKCHRRQALSVVPWFCTVHWVHIDTTATNLRLWCFFAKSIFWITVFHFPSTWTQSSLPGQAGLPAKLTAWTLSVTNLKNCISHLISTTMHNVQVVKALLKGALTSIKECSLGTASHGTPQGCRHIWWSSGIKVGLKLVLNLSANTELSSSVPGQYNTAAVPLYSDYFCTRNHNKATWSDCNHNEVFKSTPSAPCSRLEFFEDGLEFVVYGLL